MIQKLLSILVLLLSIVKHASFISFDTKSVLPLSELAHFDEGFLYGVTAVQYTGLDKCIDRNHARNQHVTTIVEKFNEETFEGMKEGFFQLGLAIKELILEVQECPQVTIDFNKLMKIADINQHPMTLQYQQYQRLLMDGIDIFKKTGYALNSYKKGDYFNFGRYLGECMNEMVAKSPYVKKPKDEYAYNFLDGYFSALPLITIDELSQMNLFNRIIDMGALLYGPIEATLQEFSEHQELNDIFWLGMSNIQNSLKEGSTLLGTKRVLNTGNLDQLYTYLECFDHKYYSDQMYNELWTLMQRAVKQYKQIEVKNLGITFAVINLRLCREDVKFND